MILLVRHGETQWNVERRFQGQKDSPLTERGRRQAVAMASLVRDLVGRGGGDWRLIASPLGRAHDTAAIIAEATGLTHETDLRLMEINCGDWEGLTWTEVSAGRDANSRLWISDAPGGETHDDVAARLEAFLADLPPEPERRVILVSHGASGRVMRGAYVGLDRETMLDLDVPQDAVFRLQNGQIDRFDGEPVGRHAQEVVDPGRGLAPAQERQGGGEKDGAKHRGPFSLSGGYGYSTGSQSKRSIWPF